MPNTTNHSEMITYDISRAVIKYYGNYPTAMREDILHTQEVVCYTKMIAQGENLSPREIDMQVSAAWLHDIGCPLSKEIHGNSLPVNQQSVGRDVAREILQTINDLSADEKEWIIDVVGTHHQFADSQKYSFTPLFEADLIVNLLSGYYKREQAANLYKSVITSKTGRVIFADVVCKTLDLDL